MDRIEVVIRPLLLSSIPHPPSAIDDTLFGQTCDVVRRRRPDFLWLGCDRCILVEIDENGGHGSANYTSICDFGWMMDMVAVLNDLYARGHWNEGKVPYVHIFRMNPDEYDCERVSMESRLIALAHRVTEVFEMQLDPVAGLLPTVEYMYYHTKCQHHIDFATAKTDSIRVIRNSPGSASRTCVDTFPPSPPKSSFSPPLPPLSPPVPSAPPAPPLFPP